MKKISKTQIKKVKEKIKFALAVVCVIVFIVFYIFNLWSPVKNTVTIKVNRGSSVTGITNYLSENNIIYSENLFYLSVRLNGGKIQAGEYDIPRGAGAWTIANMLARGKVATTTITIPEGYTIKQTKKMLKETASLSGDIDCDKSLPVCNLQDGDIFPDTYRIARGTSRLAVLELARKKMLDVK